MTLRGLNSKLGLPVPQAAAEPRQSRGSAQTVVTGRPGRRSAEDSDCPRRRRVGLERGLNKDADGHLRTRVAHGVAQMAILE